MSYSALIKKAARLIKSYLNSPDDESDYQSSNSYNYNKYSDNRNSQTNYQSSSSYSSKSNENENKNQNYQKSQSKEQQSYTNANLKDEYYYYKVLELSKGAKIDDIKKAYKTLISQYHPDKVSNLGSDLQKLAIKKTQEINEAYQYFKNKFNF
jgi:hypothetical protein